MAEENETTEETTEAAAEAPATEAPEAQPTEEPAAPAPPAEVLSPKERRQRARAKKAAKAPARKVMTAEERQEQREAERARKAQLRRVERPRARAKAKAATGDGAAVATPPREHGPGRQKTRQGVVVSDKADKSITVRIDVARPHRRYQKIVRTSNTLHAHDEANDAHIGDKVVVRECRPLSRTKRWRLIEVLERAK